MKSSNLPIVGDTIRVNIVSGGYYVAKVLNVSFSDNINVALVRISRKYKDGKITPCDLIKKTLTVPLDVSEVWEFANGK